MICPDCYKDWSLSISESLSVSYRKSLWKLDSELDSRRQVAAEEAVALTGENLDTENRGQESPVETKISNVPLSENGSLV